VYVGHDIGSRQETNKMHKSFPRIFIQGDTKKRELLKNPTKIVEIKKIIDRN
jgi:hypothetical protein